MRRPDEIDTDALHTDRYLDGLLAEAVDGSAATAAFGGEGRPEREIRLAALRIRRDLPRFHPSFRFEERLALRLADAAAAMGMPKAAGMEGGSLPHLGRPTGLKLTPADGDLLGESVVPSRGARPLIIGGALASAAMSIAGAAWVAWRLSRPGGSPMARAVRAAHAARLLRGQPD